MLGEHVLAGKEWGETTVNGTVWLYLHGFAGSGDDCSFLVAGAPGACGSWVSIDLMGHGDSSAPFAGDPYSLPWQLEGIRRLAARYPHHRRVLTGYSMGGRLALHAALRFPGLFDELVLISASPGVAGTRERAKRMQRDRDWARLIEAEGMDRFADAWEQQGVIASQEKLPAKCRKFCKNRRRQQLPHGMARTIQWLSPGWIPSLWSRLCAVRQPVHLLTGGRDEDHSERARRMLAALPNAQHTVISGSGHSLHLEDTTAFNTAISGDSRKT